MPPITSRDFLKAASQRFTTAETLLRLSLTLDAHYIGGYTVECALKALILEKTPRDTSETTAFLKTVKAIYDWVEGQLS